EYSFEVYLFQYPVHEIFVALGDVSGMFSMKVAGNNANYEGFMAFFLGLWLVASPVCAACCCFCCCSCCCSCSYY
ncbi:unnamed protein product, partial [Polarella glacialis]